MFHAITVRPNWAYAFVHLGKRIENRTFTPDSLLGRRIALHAGKHIGNGGSRPATFRGLRDLASSMVQSGYLACPVWQDDTPMLAWAESHNAAREQHYLVSEVEMPRSCVFAVATIDMAGETDRDGWAMGNHIHWLMRDLRVLPAPISCPGQQGVWRLSDDVEEQVREQLATYGVKR